MATDSTDSPPIESDTFYIAVGILGGIVAVLLCAIIGAFVWISNIAKQINDRRFSYDEESRFNDSVKIKRPKLNPSSSFQFDSPIDRVLSNHEENDRHRNDFSFDNPLNRRNAPSPPPQPSNIRPPMGGLNREQSFRPPWEDNNARRPISNQNFPPQRDPQPRNPLARYPNQGENPTYMGGDAKYY